MSHRGAKNGSPIRGASLGPIEAPLVAVKKDHNVVLFVPDGMLSREFLFKMIAVNGSAMQDAHSWYKTPEFCLDAVKRIGRTLGNVPSAVMTEEMCIVPWSPAECRWAGSRSDSETRRSA